MEDERLVGIKEVADLMAVSERTIARWVESLGLPSYKIGGTLRFSMTEVRAWLREKSTREVMED